MMRKMPNNPPSVDIDMKQELLKLKEEIESSKVQFESLQTSLNSMENRVAILTEYLTRLPSNVSVEVQTESLETRKEEALNTETAVESIKVMKKVIQKPAIDAISTHVEPVETKKLRKVRNRLKDVEARKLIDKAAKELQRYITNNKSIEKVSKARKMYEEYKKKYDSFIDALKMNIQKIVKGGSSSKLLHIRDDPRKFKIEDKLVGNSAVKKGKKGRQKVDFIVKSELDPAAFKMIQKLNRRLEGTQKHGLVKNANQKLQKYLTNNKSIEQCDEAQKQYEDHKKKYDSFKNALKANIQKIKQNGTLSNLLTVPKCPQPFEIDEKKPANISPIDVKVGKTKRKKRRRRKVAIGQEVSEKPTETVKHAVLKPATTIATPINPAVSEELQKLKCRLNGIKNNKLVQNANKRLRKYMSNNKSFEQCEEAMKQCEDYKKKYDSFIDAFDANIQKIEQSGTLKNLPIVPRCPKPFEIDEQKFTLLPSRQETQKLAESDKKREDESTISRKVTMKSSDPSALESKASIPPITPRYATSVSPGTSKKLQKLKNRLSGLKSARMLKKANKVLQKFLSSNESVEQYDEVRKLHEEYTKNYTTFIDTLKTNIQKIEENSVDPLQRLPIDPESFKIDEKLFINFEQPMKTSQNLEESEVVQMATIDSVTCKETKKQDDIAVGNKLNELKHCLEEIEEQKHLSTEKLLDYCWTNNYKEESQEALRMYDAYEESYNSFVDVLKANIQKIEENWSISDLLPLPNDPIPFEIDEKMFQSVQVEYDTQGDEKNVESLEIDVKIDPTPKSSKKRSKTDPDVLKKLQKLKNRLATIESSKLWANADKKLKKYLANNKSTEQCEEARRMYEDYKRKYDSLVYALKKNIRRIEKNGSISKLMSVPKKPRAFQIEMKNENKKQVMRELQKSEALNGNYKASKLKNPDERLLKKKAEKIQKSKYEAYYGSDSMKALRMKMIEKNDYIQYANRILKRYLRGKRSKDCKEIRKKFYVYKIDHDKAMRALKSNIVKIRNNLSIYGLKLLPMKFPTWFQDEMEKEIFSSSVSTSTIPRVVEYMIEMREKEQEEAKRHRRYIRKLERRKKVNQMYIRNQRKEKEEMLMRMYEDSVQEFPEYEEYQFEPIEPWYNIRYYNCTPSINSSSKITFIPCLPPSKPIIFKTCDEYIEEMRPKQKTTKKSKKMAKPAAPNKIKTIESSWLQRFENSHSLSETEFKKNQRIPSDAPKKLREMQHKLMRLRKKEYITDADRKLRRYLEKRKTEEQYETARKMHEEFKNRCQTYVDALKRTIEQFENYPSIQAADRLTIPKEPKRFRIDI